MVRIKIPFTRESCTITQLLFGWLTMALILCLPFISKPFISLITKIREKMESIFNKGN